MFVGRESEMAALEALWPRGKSSLVVCRGRRRIGKSTLIQQFGARADRFLEFQGLPPSAKGSGNQAQLDAFARQLAEQSSLPVFQPDDWLQVFSFLATAIDETQRTVVLLDEISWMGAGDADFAGKLKIAWDTKLKKSPRLILVLCGSISSWIDRNILNSPGFMGRISLELTVDELPLADCSSFWGKRRHRVSARERLAVLAVTGGVPRYLEEIAPQRSSVENIHNLCFRPESLLYHEFERIFADIFDRRSQSYKRIVGALVDGPKTLSQIAAAMGTQRSGPLSDYLGDLAVSGFVAQDRSYSPATGKPLRTSRYRIRDNYLRFYLKYIEPEKEKIASGIYRDADSISWLNLETIFGIQFETLVLNNLPLVLQKMQLSPATVVAASPFFRKESKTKKGVQVDLLIQTKHALYPCEVRFRNRIEASVMDEVRDKVLALVAPTSLSIRPVLIYEGELAEPVAREDFFDHCISLLADLL